MPFLLQSFSVTLTKHFISCHKIRYARSARMSPIIPSLVGIIQHSQLRPVSPYSLQPTAYPPDQVLIFNTRMGRKRQGGKASRGQGSAVRGQRGWMGRIRQKNGGQAGEGETESKTREVIS